MITSSDELLHDFEKSNEWQESFVYNFVDKKNKFFCFSEITYIPKNNNFEISWHCLYNNQEFRFSEKIDKNSKHDGSKFSSRGLKLNLTKEQNFEFTIRNKMFNAELNISPFHHLYDYPIAVDMEVDKKREKYERMLWKRFEQRCRFSGPLTIKTSENKDNKVQINCYGQRDRRWGNRLWKELIAVSSYNIQFRDMAFSLSYHDFDEIVISSGFISKKSGNIPIYETILEHIYRNPKKAISEGSEISYKDSQDDKDLIVSTSIHPFALEDIKQGNIKYERFLNLSEFNIIGAQKKGIGFENHIIQKDKISKFVLDK